MRGKVVAGMGSFASWSQILPWDSWDCGEGHTCHNFVSFLLEQCSRVGAPWYQVPYVPQPIF